MWFLFASSLPPHPLLRTPNTFQPPFSFVYRVTTADADLFCPSSEPCPCIGQFPFFGVCSPSSRTPWTLAATSLDAAGPPALSAHTIILHFSIVDCQRAETSCFIVLDNCYHTTAHRRRKVCSRLLPRSCTRRTTEAYSRRLAASSTVTRTVSWSDRFAGDNACRLATRNRGQPHA